MKPFKQFKLVKDSSVTVTVKPDSRFFPFLLMLLLMLVFCGNAVLWKVMEKSGKSVRIFPQLTHNTWKSRQKRPTFPHSHKTFSLRSLKCGKTRYFTLHPKTFFQIPALPFRLAYQIMFFHIPTIFGYFLFYDKKYIGKKAKSTFIFLSFMVYKNGSFNCRRGERLVVVDQACVLPVS